MQWLTKCLSCNGSVYLLSDGRVKCSKCNKKRSLQKINRTITLIQCFVQNESALSVSKRMGASYVSVQKYYETFRLLSAQICEAEYETLRDKPCEYEEYFYLEPSKRLKPEAVFDAHNFLTFDYDKHIYTLLMPSLSQYKTQMLEDNVQDAYIDEFKRFKRESKIIKVNKRYNNIMEFWDYFEESILTYKGVSDEKFAYFLKEFEFKYNHLKNEAKDLLIEEYFKG